MMSAEVLFLYINSIIKAINTLQQESRTLDSLLFTDQQEHNTDQRTYFSN